MAVTRRDLLAAAAALPVAGAASGRALASAEPAGPAALPDRASFVPTGLTYLDSGTQHPISLKGKAAVDAYMESRMLHPAAESYNLDEDRVLEKFAKLINADREEVTFVQSTTAGEQMVLRALGFPEAGGHIVTDTLHFFGSFPTYAELDQQGMEVTWLRARDGRIPIEDVRRAVRDGTKLVALSLVSTFNGFQHDLKAVCDIAHAHGALVYADIIHAAGCIPVDVKESGVDFAACASYKWLMGDFGLGFLYARKDVLPRLERAHYGYYAVSAFQTHIYPFDPPGSTIVDYAFADSTRGHFALGTRAHGVAALLDHSLDYIMGLRVPNIQAHAQTMTDRLKEELPRLGYTLITPMESKTPLVACILPDARKLLAAPLKEANVRITLSSNRFRVSPSVFNDMSDIDRLLAALPRV